jgi:Family of unknown function (DUF5372)
VRTAPSWRRSGWSSFLSRKAEPAPWASPYSQYTTLLSQPSLGFVTIVHPHHPLRGQRCEVVRVRRGANPDVVLRLPDGSRAAIALSWTDYDNAAPPEQSKAELPLLDLDGLRRAAQLIAHMRQEGRLRNRPKPSRHRSSSASPSR